MLYILFGWEKLDQHNNTSLKTDVLFGWEKLDQHNNTSLKTDVIFNKIFDEILNNYICNVSYAVRIHFQANLDWKKYKEIRLQFWKRFCTNITCVKKNNITYWLVGFPKVTQKILLKIKLKMVKKCRNAPLPENYNKIPIHMLIW